MSKIVRMTSDVAASSEELEVLKRLAERPDAEIRTDLIAEKPFNLKLAKERREKGWIPGRAVFAHKKAS